MAVFACLARFWEVRLILCPMRAHRHKMTDFSVNTSGAEGEEKHLLAKGSVLLGVREAEVCSCLVLEVSAVPKREMALNLDPLPAEPFLGWPYGHRKAVAGGLRCLRTKPRTPSERQRRPDLDFLAGNQEAEASPGELCFGVGVRVQSKASLLSLCRTQGAGLPAARRGGPRKCGRCGALPAADRRCRARLRGIPRILPALAASAPPLRRGRPSLPSPLAALLCRRSV